MRTAHVAHRSQVVSATAAGQWLVHLGSDTQSSQIHAGASHLLQQQAPSAGASHLLQQQAPSAGHALGAAVVAGDGVDVVGTGPDADVADVPAGADSGYQLRSAWAS